MTGVSERGPAWMAVLLVLVLRAVPVYGQADGARYDVHVSRFLMGTYVEATVVHDDPAEAERALRSAFEEMDRIEHRFSVHMEDSEASRINREAADAPVQVSEEMMGLLQRAASYSARFEGLFDITVGPLTEAWGFSGDEPISVPDSAEIRSLDALVGIDGLLLDPTDTTVAFARPGMAIDLGGIAKGYAIDRAAAVLRAAGLNDFMINAGGDLFLSGRNASGQPWRVGVRHPRQADALLATLSITDQAVATSGDYERYTIVNGHRYHHILDPRTGYPAEGSRSTTVIAATAEEADAWATYLFVRGMNSPPRDASLAFLGVDGAGKIHVTPTMREDYDLEVLADDSLDASGD